MIDFVAYLAGIFGMVSFIPQIVKSARSGRMEDVSWLLLLTTFASVSLYEIYAIALGLIPVIIMNGIFLVTVLATLVLKWKLQASPTGEARG